MVVSGVSAAEVRTTDISEGGLGVAAAASPGIGSRFRIRFGLPHAGKGTLPVEAEVIVVRSILAQDEGGFKIGLRFVSMDDTGVRSVKKFVDRRWDEPEGHAAKAGAP